ncbi:MAG: MinD/ParA family protein [Nitrospirae bacterium]|nr:MinD/ParA family protein [Nitrospirota bacterium]
MDQAQTLREWVGASEPITARPPKVIAVTSGKGGVGKTNVVANLAVALSGLGQRVVVLDADLGLGNLDILFGIVHPYTLEDVLLGHKTLSDILVPGPCGIQILPAGSGGGAPAALTSEQQLGLLAEVDRWDIDLDVLLIDTGAGISPNVLYFNTVAQDIVVVASTDPTSLTDAYAMMKVLSQRHGETRFKLLVNMVRTESEAREVFRKLSVAADEFLDISIDYVGAIPDDDYLRRAVGRQRAVVELYPRARSSAAFVHLARAIGQWPTAELPKGSAQFMLRRFMGRDADRQALA